HGPCGRRSERSCRRNRSCRPANRDRECSARPPWYHKGLVTTPNSTFSYHYGCQNPVDDAEQSARLFLGQPEHVAEVTTNGNYEATFYLKRPCGAIVSCFPLLPPLKKGRPTPRRGVRQARRPALGAGDRQDRQASCQPAQVAGGFDNKGYRGHQVWPESRSFPRILIVFRGR